MSRVLDPRARQTYLRPSRESSRQFFCRYSQSLTRWLLHARNRQTVTEVRNPIYTTPRDSPRLQRPPGTPATCVGHRLGAHHFGDTSAGHRAGDDLRRTRRDHLNVPSPIRERALTAALQGLHSFHSLRSDSADSALPLPTLRSRPQVRPQASLDIAQLLPLEELLTPGLDPTRFQTKPPACYRHSWQLPTRISAASDDELTNEVPVHQDPASRWTHERRRLGAWVRNTRVGVLRC
jgi:hypothetical protein